MGVYHPPPPIVTVDRNEKFDKCDTDEGLGFLHSVPKDMNGAVGGYLPRPA